MWLKSYAALHQCDVCSILTDTCESCGEALNKKTTKAHKRRISKALETCNRRKQAAQEKYQQAIARFKDLVETFEKNNLSLGQWYEKAFAELRSQFGINEKTDCREFQGQVHRRAKEKKEPVKIVRTYEEGLQILQDAMRDRSEKINNAFSGPQREAYSEAQRVRTDEIRLAENYLAAEADFVIGIYNCHIVYKRELARIRENVKR